MGRQNSAIERWLLPSPAQLIFIATFLLVLMAGQHLSNRDGDLGRHLAVGERILETVNVPGVDEFSHTMRGEPFIPHEWLAEIMFALAYRAGEFRGVALLTALCIALTFGGLMTVMLRKGIGPLVAGLLCGLGMMASMIHWAARPHIFSFIFVLCVITQLENLRRKERTHVWIVIPLTLLWANVHGAFIIGFVLMGTYLLADLISAFIVPGEARRGHLARAGHLVIVLAGSILASAINPSGFRLVANSVDYLDQSYLLSLTSEYNSPDFHHPLFLPFLVLLLLTALVAVRRHIAPTLLLLSWMAFSLHSFRNIPLFVIICLPFIAEGVEDYVSTLTSRVSPVFKRMRAAVHELDADLRTYAALQRLPLPAILVVLLSAALLLGGRSIALDGSDYGFRSDEFPVEALQQLGPTLPGERVFNKLHWGGYILYAASPPIDVFIDGQTDFYGSQLTREYMRVISAEPGWADVLERYAVDWILVSVEDPIARQLISETGWLNTYQDATAIIFIRAPIEQE
jgi:hypothetical protein